MRLERIESKERMEEVIRFCYEEDDALIAFWHLRSGTSREVCIEDTVSMLSLVWGSLEFYIIVESAEIIGYFGKEVGMREAALTSFFIRPKYRTEEVVMFFWELVESKMPDSFVCGLFDKNKPAIKFVEKHDGTAIKSGALDGEPYSFYLIQNQSCQLHLQS